MSHTTNNRMGHFTFYRIQRTQWGSSSYIKTKTRSMKSVAITKAVERAYVLVRQWKITALFLVGLAGSLAADAQSFIGYGYDNYSGINSILLNPGMLAG